MAKTPTPNRTTKTSPVLTSIAQTPEPARGDHAAREQQIAQRAYLRAEQRGFAPGNELDDWLAAEREIDGAKA